MLPKSELKLDHFFRLTDSTGMIQHSKYSIPDFSTGYTTDDNARALIAACMLYKKSKNEKLLSLIYTYLSFLFYAQNSRGRWKNFMNYQRQFIEEEGSEDSFGRSIWGIGYLYSTKHIPSSTLLLANHIMKNTLPNLEKLISLRAQAYSIIGLTYLVSHNNKTFNKKLVENLADKLLKLYSINSSKDWLWFEDIIAYANGILPYSLLKAYELIPNKDYLKISLESLDFLDSLVMSKEHLKLVGCNGWAIKGKPIAEFDEQPIDAADMFLAYSKAYEVTKNTKYLERAKISIKWFWGKNCKNVSLIDSETGGCFDGLTKTGANLNQGAESLLVYLISYLTADEMGILGE